MGYRSTITSKGQTTIPRAIRDHLKLRTGDQIEFTIAGDEVKVIAKNLRLIDLIGFLGPPPRGAGSTIEEMDDAVGRALAEDDERIMREWHEGRR